MQYRKLGNTGFEVSAIGLGCGTLSTIDTHYAVNLVKRALALGVNYLDTARGYGDSEIKVGLALKKIRDQIFLSTKTRGHTKEQAWKHIRESLQRLHTDYFDNCHLHNLRDIADVETRLGPGGALEALIEAHDKGIVRHIGCTSHRSEVLLTALERFPFEIISIPMNIVEREPLKTLIPLCQRRGVGITIMKPVAAGLLPAQLALKWLLNQPIATALPGAVTIEEVEENSSIGHLPDATLTVTEQEQLERLTHQFDHVWCRFCYTCEPCPVDIPIGFHLGTDVMHRTYDHYKTLGHEKFFKFPWSRNQLLLDIAQYRESIAAIQSCTECGACEKQCPHELPIIHMLQDMVEPMKMMIKVHETLLNE